MKTLTICLIIVFVSVFGLKSKRIVSDLGARTNLKTQGFKAEELYGFSKETFQEGIIAKNGKEIDFSYDEKYIPDQFKFLKKEDEDKLFPRILYKIILNKNND